MFSPLTTIGIFTEVFASGLILAGIYSFIKKFMEGKEAKDLFLALIFLGLLLFTTISVLSQILYNLGGLISTLIALQKILVINFLAMSLLLLVFIRLKFNLRPITPLIILFLVPVLYYIFQILALPSSSISLTFSPDVIEPQVVLGRIPQLARPLWAVGWAILAIAAFISSLYEKGRKRMLLSFTLGASIFFIASYFCTNLYLFSTFGIYLIASWACLLFGVMGLILGEVISPTSELAHNPLNFIRTRILFKLLFIFILLIVILFEITTLAMIEMSKQALYNSVIENYQEIIKGIDDKVEDLPAFDQKALEKLVIQKSSGDLFVYIIDRNGEIIAHPDETVVKSRINISDRKFVKELLSGKSGGGQFPQDEFFTEKVGAYIPIRKFGGGIIIEEPVREAYVNIRRLETNSLLFIIAGIALTVFCGIFFASSIEKPIRQLIKGTEAISKGELGHQINVDSKDEIGALAAAFNKMTKDLKDSQERLILSEKLASLGTMAAGMAHEIKNPLVSLRTFSQILQQKWDDPEFREKFSQIVPNEIERINKIAESLLKFGRPTKTELTRVNLNGILEDVLMLFENECKKNNIHVSTKFAQLPEIIGDSSQLSQAFVNIILNAIQSMEEKNGGELTVKTDVGEVVRLGRPSLSGVEKEKGEVAFESEVESPQPIPAVFVEVTDTGPGIEPDKIKSLFDPFFTTKVKGTGMGLPITLRSIEEHKGSIKVKSQLGKGTSFLITLPQRMDQI